MDIQSVFKRYELKYLITKRQKEIITDVVTPYMEMDEYGRTIIRNIYFDTDDYRLIRRSIEKPMFKEKIRIRSYRRAAADEKVFVELKRKYNSVVYKRRCISDEKSAMKWLTCEERHQSKNQIEKEINYFINYYDRLSPKLFISYEREAYRTKQKSNFRVTFDENILCREDELSLSKGVWGIPILDENMTLMEIKCSGGIPLWMTKVLSDEKIYKISFSKYGTAYKNIIYPKIKEEEENVRKIV